MKTQVNKNEADDFDFGLPRFSSCVPEVSYDKVKNKFEYLHENIDDANLHDPALEMMPILKNITKKNLIPVIDFEEFNNLQKSKAAPGKQAP